MLETVHGDVRNRVLAKALVEVLEDSSVDGTLYLGFPVLSSADDQVRVDALLVGEGIGVVALLFGDVVPATDDEWDAVRAEQDRLYNALESHLGRHEGLRKGRQLAVRVETATLFPVDVKPTVDMGDATCVAIDKLPAQLAGHSPVPAPVYRALQAAIQRVSTIKPVKKRAGVKKPASRGAIMKVIEREMANLDQWQKRAAIEVPEGPQRVRGLAGSGKTVVLALKAAYLHTRHPDWDICVTFASRALYQQFRDLIRRFCFEYIQDEPDWTRLRVLHSWGGSDRDGVYRTIARAMNSVPRDFQTARGLFGDDPFGGACAELLAVVEGAAQVPQLFDVMLIDEAQDLSPAFFQLVWHVSRKPKRIVWAYDELQMLSERGMPSTSELFGKNADGSDRVDLSQATGGARTDVILPVCYRNPPWTLSTAHALGFGVYRRGGLVQHFDSPELWREIGYSVVGGTLAPGHRVRLKREHGAYPEFFDQLLNAADSVQAFVFSNSVAQAEWVAEQVHRNLTEDELEYDDVLIVLPDAYTAKTQSKQVMAALTRRGLAAHLAGVTSSRDELYVGDSVAITHIYRAKGNEAPMVYVLDCQRAASGSDLRTQRNILFTAITRSRAWVRLCGFGSGMELIEQEVREVSKQHHALDFVVPDAATLAKLRRIHRDRTDAERAQIDGAQQNLAALLSAIEKGDLPVELLDPSLRDKLRRVFREGHDGEE